MADDQGQDPKDGGQDPTASSASADAPQDSGTGPDPTPKDGDPKVEDELRRARDDAAKFRTQLREAQKSLEDAQKQLQAKDDEGKSELQKAMDRVGELEGRTRVADGTVRDLRLQNAVLVEAMKKDIVDPDAAFRLLDKDQVDYDGDRPTNVADLLDDLIEDRPYLKATKEPKAPHKAPSSASPTQPASPGGRKLTMEDIEKMSSAEINARWDEVQPVLAASKGR